MFAIKLLFLIFINALNVSALPLTSPRIIEGDIVLKKVTPTSVKVLVILN